MTLPDRPPGRTSARTALLLAVAMGVLSPCAFTARVAAQDRLVRRFGPEQGLSLPPVTVLAQDRRGFLWIGAEGGLYRSDASGIRRWAPEVVRDAVVDLAPSPDGGVVGLDFRGVPYRVDADGARALPGPGPPLPGAFRTLAFDAEGALWLLYGGRLARRGVGGEWAVLPEDAFAGETPRRLRASPDGAVLVGTEAGVWWLGPGERSPRRVMDAGAVADLLALEDGRLLVLTWDGRVLERGADGVVRERLPGPDGRSLLARGVALAARGGTVWVSLDRFLVALRAGAPPEVLGPEDGVVGAGPPFVDREGSLWLASFAGLSQYPEAETRIWRDRHGLPSQHTRHVVRAGDRLWVSTWQGTASLRRSGAGWRAEAETWAERGRPCVDARGAVWLSGASGELIELRGAVVVRRHPELTGSLYGCVVGRDGALWLATAQGLALTAPGAVRRIEGLPLPGPHGAVAGLLRDRGGRLWIAQGDRVCRAPEAAVRAGAAESWRCETVDGAVDVVDLREMPSGEVWAATRTGIFARGDGGWRRIPATEEFPSRMVFRMAPSPAGGVWIVGHGVLQRVRERRDLPAGWEVLERLSAWHGLPAVGGGDLHEDGDGTVWITTSQGLVQVPPGARFTPVEAPAVAMLGAFVGDAAVRSDSGLGLARGEGPLEVHFAALSFRDPGRLRYQVRLGSEDPWSDARGVSAFRWADLRPGRYRAEFRASLDGRSWSPEPARVAFVVHPPWYGRPWAIAAFIALGIGAALLAYRARVAFLLGLERQRTRIAMDLHDEVGSGLGSVGILSGVLAGGVVEGDDGRAIAAEIARTAEMLGDALSDIVWSLDARGATLAELGARLGDAGQRLLAGDDVEFRTATPEAWPERALPLAVRRNVLLIGLEALHNAVRHARASRVTLALARRGGGWELSVHDDGIGLPPGPVLAEAGVGFRSMRRRAEEIGADVRWTAAPGGGTVVTLRFDPWPRAAGRLRRLARLLRPRRRTGRPHDRASARAASDGQVSDDAVHGPEPGAR